MASRQKILLLGATGETGASILNGLLASNQFDVEILVRPSSAEKPAVQEIKALGVALRVVDITAPEQELAPALAGIDIIISAIGPHDLLQQKTLKEEIYNEIKRLEVPYTVIDVGFWHQISIPPLPSGRIDYALMMAEAVIHGGGNAPNLLTDLRDIGRFVARIVVDDRTLNRYVYTWSDVLSENEIFDLVEEVSGEKIERKYETAQQIEKRLDDALAALSLDPNDPAKRIQVYVVQYMYSKYIRGDNQPRYAKYLGYLDARELYPDLKPVSFRDCFVEVLEGKGKRPYY